MCRSTFRFPGFFAAAVFVPAQEDLFHQGEACHGEICVHGCWSFSPMQCGLMHRLLAGAVG